MGIHTPLAVAAAATGTTMMLYHGSEMTRKVDSDPKWVGEKFVVEETPRPIAEIERNRRIAIGAGLATGGVLAATLGGGALLSRAGGAAGEVGSHLVRFGMPFGVAAGGLFTALVLLPVLGGGIAQYGSLGKELVHGATPAPLRDE